MARIINKEEKRLDIARASIELFATKGIAQTSIDEIAKNAGVAKGTIYLYFKNKEEIIFAIRDMLSQRHDEAYHQRINPNLSTKEKITEYYNFSECGEDYNKELMLTFYQHFVSYMLINKSGLYTAYFECSFDKDYALISSCLKEGIEKGELYIDDIEMLTNTIILILKGILIKAKADNMSFAEAQIALMKHVTYLLDQCTRKEP